ncbi:MAG: trypsin-like serine protease [SAR202 cluster bacterium]|nr:trypsin-like peptidase domain-containing protein [SAR202 cluster bacterium]MQG57578.1 trypsin-like serine protease [SAR202 cluster bacterium]
MVVPEPTAEPAPSETAEAPPVVEGTGNSNEVGVAMVSLTTTDQALPTVEIVKLLTPSTVQVVTEVAGMAFSNSPIPPTGVGTGVILDLEGHILTNNHVVDSAQRITVTLSSGESFPAVVVGRDQATDLAIIRIEAEGLTPARLGVSAELEVGEDTIAIGHALGLLGGPTVSKGVVSALGRTINTDAQTTMVDLIQTDASINPGNSGGPLANDRAEVIGINTAIIQEGRGIGFAINIDDAKVVASQLMERGYVSRGFLGIRPVNLSPSIANQLGLDVKTEGVFIAFVIEDTAADLAGLLTEDVILELGDEAIRNTGELSKFLIAHPPSETVDILIIRQGQEISGQITLGMRPE